MLAKHNNLHLHSSLSVSTDASLGNNSYIKVKMGVLVRIMSGCRFV